MSAAASNTTVPTVVAKKGQEGGICNRSACDRAGADWWNTSTRAWYCVVCANAIMAHHGNENLLVTRVSLPSAAPLPSEPPASFVEYVTRNYPPRVVISDPKWHAPKLWRAAVYAMEARTR
jgi:hypothetical protein